MTILDEATVDLPTPTGPMRLYVFRPSDERKYPGVMLFSEIFQVTGPIRRAAAMLAGHGYVVAVPEVYHGLNLPGPFSPTTSAERTPAMYTSMRKNYPPTMQTPAH